MPASKHQRTKPAILFVLLVIFSILALGGVSDIEKEIFGVISNSPLILKPLAFLLIQLGTLIPAYILSAALIATEHKLLGWQVILATTSAWVIALIMKEVVGRARPLAEGLGFPSSHAAVVAALACVFAHHLRSKVARSCVWLVASLSACSRIYLEMHFPLDVLAGFTLGLITGLVTLAVFSNYPAFKHQLRDRQSSDF